MYQIMATYIHNYCNGNSAILYLTKSIEEILNCYLFIAVIKPKGNHFSK